MGKHLASGRTKHTAADAQTVYSIVYTYKELHFQ